MSKYDVSVTPVTAVYYWEFVRIAYEEVPDAKLICLEVEGVAHALWNPPEKREKFVLALYSLQQYM